MMAASGISSTGNERTIRVLLVIDSWQGHTARVADRVAAGIRAEGAEVVLRSADDATRADLIAANALMMGSAVHQRAMTWKMKRFVDEVCEPAWFFLLGASARCLRLAEALAAARKQPSWAC